MAAAIQLNILFSAAVKAGKGKKKKRAEFHVRSQQQLTKIYRRQSRATSHHRLKHIKEPKVHEAL